MEERKILYELNASKGYDIALLTTFNFDTVYFERAVFRVLNDNGIKKVSVFVDQNELNSALQTARSSEIGKKYAVNPVEINKAFHPKLILLLGKSQAKLFVMSANLTVSGFSTKREIFNCFEMDSKNTENLGLIRSAADFFIELYNSTHRQDEALFDEIKRLPYLRGSVGNSQATLIHNLVTPIFTQITEAVPNAEQIDIAVPYYDNYLSALNKIREQYPDARINLYLQNRKTRIKDKAARDLGANTFIYDTIGERSAFYHGKVFRFITPDKEYILYGSANCTASAVLKTPKTDGNVECDVLEFGDKGAFDGFFEAFLNPCKDEVSFDLLTYSPNSTNKFYFRYGVAEDNYVKMYIGCHNKPSNFAVLWRGMEQPYTSENDSIIIKLPIEEVALAETESDFSLDIQYEDKTDTLICWYNNADIISINREKERKGAVYAFNPFATGSDFYKDRTAILKWISMTPEEAEEESRVMAMMHPDNSDDEPEDADDDEGVVDYVIPETVYVEKYEQYLFAQKCCTSLANDYFGRSKQQGSRVSSGEQTNNENSDEKNNEDAWNRVPLSEEKRFVRFVKYRVNLMLRPEFVKRDDFMRYWNGTHLFFNIFDKYHTATDTHNLFTDEYIAETKAKLLHATISKSYPNEYKEDVITIVFRSLVEACLLIPMDKEEAANTKKLYKKMVRTLDKKYDLRESYSKYILPYMDYTKYHESSAAKSFIDGLFGYMPLKNIRDIISDVHGLCNVIYTSKEMIVEVETDSVRNYMNLERIKYLMPLTDYVRVKGRPSTLKIILNNTKPIYNNYTHAKQIIYDIDLKKRQYIQTIIRASGRQEKTGTLRY